MKSESVLIASYVKQVKASDEKAFRKLFDLLWEPLYYYAFSLLEDETLAKDMVQDVWVDFWERKNDIQNDNVKAYLYKAVRFRVLKELRNIKFQESHLEALKKVEVSEEADAEEDVVTMEDTKMLIEQKLQVLPDKCKEVFKLSRLEGLKNKEIAEELGISESTVENHITKAFKLLKKSAALLMSLVA
ncbi:RNA polymerase sigma-70 factor [Neptunitalea lumnitzerae]|uniref:DNA-directed RNA polymerase sigma-70 factor n=1 Tax=Neptunitalea lumnitzerae TaxID=2965509 RepID=A0ABQ5MET2_9FLAO|nr:RNA polymerase sigma-70 factor [Neptunitalea sp. Y10]GLB47910.1 DNA-directed RNA polymerase sigma-70 factor [Neptunitalea sp. Y10]